MRALRITDYGFGLVAATALLLSAGSTHAATGWAVSDIFTLDTRSLSAPAGVSASDGAYPDKIRITWSAVSAATKYFVYRHTANASASAALVAEVTSTTCDDRTNTAGITYYFWVKAGNASTNSDFSDSASGWRRSRTTRIVGDYDGDRKADPAIYDPATGTWNIRLSSAGYAPLELAGLLGGADFMPASADYDGDGKTDPAVYSENTGEWIVLLSGSGYYRLDLPGFLGGAGQSPAPGDYDGDRKAGPAVYREATGDWRVMLSGSAYYTVELASLLGGPGYGPAPADFDGDQKADPAVYAEATGDWRVLLSASGYYLLELPGFLGGPGWTPAPADYDGDGKADPAVHDEITNEWRVMLSTAGYQIISVILP